MERWLLEIGAARIGLVELLRRVAEEEKELSPVHAYIERLATRAKTDFFSVAIAPSSDDESAFIKARRPLTLDFVWDEDLSASPVPIGHWGINE